jgi:hypothetical protein
LEYYAYVTTVTISKEYFLKLLSSKVIKVAFTRACDLGRVCLGFSETLIPLQ